jgi:hypothetical protein
MARRRRCRVVIAVVATAGGENEREQQAHTGASALAFLAFHVESLDVLNSEKAGHCRYGFSTFICGLSVLPAGSIEYM